MKRIAIFCVAAVALSACTSTGSIDTAIQNSLPQICAAADIGYAAYKPLADAGKVKSEKAYKVDMAYSQIKGYCANASSQTLASTLVAATTAYAVITTALKEASAAQ